MTGDEHAASYHRRLTVNWLLAHPGQLKKRCYHTHGARAPPKTRFWLKPSQRRNTKEPVILLTYLHGPLSKLARGFKCIATASNNQKSAPVVCTDGGSLRQLHSNSWCPYHRGIITSTHPSIRALARMILSSRAGNTSIVQSATKIFTSYPR